MAQVLEFDNLIICLGIGIHSSYYSKFEYNSFDIHKAIGHWLVVVIAYHPSSNPEIYTNK